MSYRTAFNSASVGRIFSSALPPFGGKSFKQDLSASVHFENRYLPEASAIMDFECNFTNIDFTGHGHFKYINDKLTVNGIKAPYPKDFTKVEHEPKLVKTLYKFMLGTSSREFREFDPILFDMEDIHKGTSKIKVMRTIDPTSTFYRVELPISKKGRTEHLISKGEGVMTFIDTSSLPIGDNPYSQFVATKSNQIEAEYTNNRERYTSSMSANAVSTFGNIVGSLLNPIA